MRWVIAIDLHSRSDSWVHAYDLETSRLPHPLGSAFEVRADQPWTDPAQGPRCQHCVEQVGH